MANIIKLLVCSRISINIFSILLTSLGLVVSAQASIIQSATDSFNNLKPGNSVKLVDTPRRAGTKAFRHEISNSGERSEIGTPRVHHEGTYWYGWSFMHTGSIPGGKFTIVHQMFMGNRPANEWPCGGAGHKTTIRNGELLYYLQHSVSGGDLEWIY
jgi:hypothetical protein